MDANAAARHSDDYRNHNFVALKRPRNGPLQRVPGTNQLFDLSNQLVLVFALMDTGIRHLEHALHYLRRKRSNNQHLGIRLGALNLINESDVVHARKWLVEHHSLNLDDIQEVESFL